MKILILNAGSSSQKSCLYELGEALPNSPIAPLWEAKIDWTGKSNAALLQVETATGASLEEELPVEERQKAIAQMLNTLWRGSTQVISQLSEIDIVGHRVVHGGQEYREATPITPEVKSAINRLSALAPEHNPVNLEGIEAIENSLGDVPQVAVFDTAFHSQLPLAAAVYPGPYEWLEKGIRRYGFHGISHQYVASRAAQLLGKEVKSLRLITCHLGNGCSLAAVRHGVCVDTTMGYTPLEGLMMGSRSGSVDPSILIHLLRQGSDAEKLNHILNKQSGLKGISGISGDMRQISKLMAEGHDRAQLAFDIYIHSLRSHIGAMLASLGGLDALVFSGGVGENAAPVRAGACGAFEFLGLKLNYEKNNDSPADEDVATPDSPVRVLVVKTQEDWAIAQECWKLAQTGSP
ncbi:MULTISPECIES: acetate kinase [unclassified Coleofasciculus]|uniref:acetate kinase n=1 Tax=unclassified Coleofasciculus TaxID=2692782 RepID=UPI00187F82CA|nr:MULTISPECIES: acetate kinase [unclassified Coleofasciculus]MBE9129039.1 acetate kinase [Coleofasciculus sp. LEGE 07081]MBE9151638.1 acetate kinase [Coleofasciculus sp. LEGE 07092]